MSAFRLQSSVPYANRKFANASKDESLLVSVIERSGARMFIMTHVGAIFQYESRALLCITLCLINLIFLISLSAKYSTASKTRHVSYFKYILIISCKNMLLFYLHVVLSYESIGVKHENY